MKRIIQDTHSLEWLAVKEYCEAQLVDLREYNDRDLSQNDTQTVRGQIKFAKKVLLLGVDDDRLVTADEEGGPNDETYLR